MQTKKKNRKLVKYCYKCKLLGRSYEGILFRHLDILFQDAVGMNSARANGATIVLLGEEGDILNVLAVYHSLSGVTAENYVFDTNQKVMFVTTTRTLDAISTLQSKASIRWANCR